jgi:hypothetical protein
MAACQELLLRRSIAGRFQPPMSVRVPLFGLTGGCLPGEDRRSQAVAANLPNQTFTITSNCRRDPRKNRDANTRFWVDLTIFRMNTCTKRVGGGGPILNSYFNSARRMRVPHPSVSRVRFLSCLAPAASRREGSLGRLRQRVLSLPEGSGAVFPRTNPGLACNCTREAIALQCGSRLG